MDTTDTPLLFSNSCGKLFTGSVVFATAFKETEIRLTDVKKVRFSWHFSRAGLAFMFLPLPLFIIPFHFPESDATLQFLICLLGVLFILFSAYNISKKFRLRIFLKNGDILQWNVWQGNQKDTRQFINRLNKQLAQAS